MSKNCVWCLHCEFGIHHTLVKYHVVAERPEDALRWAWNTIKHYPELPDMPLLAIAGVERVVWLDAILPIQPTAEEIAAAEIEELLR